MMKFRYNGCFQARKIEDKGQIVFDGNLVPQNIYNLPENNSEIRAFVASGFLVPIVEDTKEETLLPAASKAKKDTK